MKLFHGQLFPEVILMEEEQQHIQKVLRMRQGEELFVTDGKGNLAKGTLLYEGKKVHINVVEVIENTAPLSSKLHIAIAPTKNMDRIEFFLEKAVEMGVSKITFLQTEKSERKNLNHERLCKQSIAASKQSLRIYFPEILPMEKLTTFISNIESENTFVAHCHKNLKRISLQNINVNNELKPLTFIIGPEGDFSENEIQLMTEKGIQAVSLGNQRLRTETAGIFVAAWNYAKTF